MGDAEREKKKGGIAAENCSSKSQKVRAHAAHDDIQPRGNDMAKHAF